MLQLLLTLAAPPCSRPNMSALAGVSLLLAVLLALTAAESGHRRLLLILLDGFRWDYLQQPGLRGFPRLSKEGVRAEYMEVGFPSESYPGYYAVTTGLYGESNGMIMNYMYDKQHKEFFLMDPHPNISHPFWWEDATPLWVSAVQNNLSVGIYLWPGGSVVVHNTKPKVIIPYSAVRGNILFREHLDKVTEAFHKNHLDFAMVYCESTDIEGHAHGPESPEVKHAVLELDSAIFDLLDKLESKGLRDSVNVVVVSDHGMTATDANTVQTVDLNQVINMDEVEQVLDKGSHMSIFPKPNALDKIYQDLKQVDGIEVYKKEELPERYHIKHHRRTPPIVIVAKPKYFIAPLRNIKQIPAALGSSTWNGFHGYDPQLEDMRGIFLAWGPGLKQNYVSAGINIVDPYNLMTQLLGIPAQPNNGSWDRVKPFLTSNSVQDNSNNAHIFTVPIPRVIVFSILPLILSLL